MPEDDYYDASPEPKQKKPQWMSALKDTVSLSELSIPGTHDSMTFHDVGFWEKIVEPIVQTQSWSLSLQLMGGIRFVDIRCRHFENGLPIHHGEVYLHTSFEDVLRDTTSFLSRFPTETILMRVKKEYEAANNSESMSDTVIRYLKKFPANKFWLANRIPTLRESRGKIVILQDFPGADLGIRYSNLDIEDNWDVSNLNSAITVKWDLVRNHLEAARGGSRSRTYLTYASGASAFAFPYAVAKAVNCKLYEFLKGNDRRRLGIVCMDYPGCPLIQQIIERNK